MPVLKSVLKFPHSVAMALAVPIHMAIANRRVSKSDISTENIEALSEKDLEELIRTEWIRARDLDEKLHKMTTVLSVGVVIGGLVSTTMLQSISGSTAKYVAINLYLLATILLLIGVVLGFNGLLPKKRYGYGAAYMKNVAVGGETARSEMIAAAREFQRDNLIRSNETTAAVVSIRNGVLVFALGIAANLYALAIAEPDAPQEPPIILVEAVTTRGRAALRLTSYENTPFKNGKQRFIIRGKDRKRAIYS